MASPPSRPSPFANSKLSSRRTSLPAVIVPPRVRTPNTLSPKLGFLKEISEFDMEPPFISPAASSSSSADNSNCASPMPPTSPSGRPQSARLYRRYRKSASKQFRKQDFDQDFQWKEVDTFHGRKHSIPLHKQLDGALLLNGDGDDSAVASANEDIEEDYGSARQLSPRLARRAISPILSSMKQIDSPPPRKTYASLRREAWKEPAQRSLEVSVEEKEEEEEEEDEGEEEYEMNLNGGIEADAIDEEEEELEENEDVVENGIGEVEEKTNGTGRTEKESWNKGKVLNSSVEDSHLDSKIIAGAAQGGKIEMTRLRKALKARSKRAKQAQFLRSFTMDSTGRVQDNGVRSVGGALFKPPVANSAKCRRATCPEIFLSVADEDHHQRVVTKCTVRMYGCATVGKKSVAKKLASIADVDSPNDDVTTIASEDIQRPYKTVSFLMNDLEVQMEIVQGSAPESSNRSAQCLTLFIVVYSVDNRESFIRAAQILYRLFESRRNSGGKKSLNIPLVLVANKIDLQRKRKVTSIEGKMLAKIYKCPFVEMSALLSMNDEGLWQEVLRRLQKHKEAKERKSSEYGRVRHVPARNRLVGRIFQRTRRFAKSCEDWLAARIIAI